MRTETQHPLVTRYLKDLDRALRDVPGDRRREIVDAIRSHIAEAAADRGDEMTEAELRTLLEQVGHPDAIADDTRDRLGIRRRRGGAMEGVAIFGLLIGGLVVPVVGWVVGVVLLWTSSAWSTRDKILGTLVVPGGLAAPLFLGAFAMSASSCVTTSTGSDCVNEVGIFTGGEILLVGLALAPIAVAIYLGLKAFRR